MDAALAKERAQRELLRSKRQEIDSVQSVINKVKNARSVEDIDVRVRTSALSNTVGAISLYEI